MDWFLLNQQFSTNNPSMSSKIFPSNSPYQTSWANNIEYVGFLSIYTSYTSYDHVEISQLLFINWRILHIPSRINSSFWADELTHVTPLYMFTRRINFSPRKLRISTNVLFSEMATLMGKWAYTVRILYRNPLVTPMIMFWTWEQTVRTVASSFLIPNHLRTVSVFGSGISIWTWTWRKLRVSAPRGPVIVTTRDRTLQVTFWSPQKQIIKTGPQNEMQNHKLYLYYYLWNKLSIGVVIQTIRTNGEEYLWFIS